MSRLNISKRNYEIHQLATGAWPASELLAAKRGDSIVSRIEVKNV
jgi:hypothetical protein